jgi:hypothetical protein
MSSVHAASNGWCTALHRLLSALLLLLLLLPAAPLESWLQDASQLLQLRRGQQLQL